MNTSGHSLSFFSHCRFSFSVYGRGRTYVCCSLHVKAMYPKLLCMYRLGLFLFYGYSVPVQRSGGDQK